MQCIVMNCKIIPFELIKVKSNYTTIIRLLSKSQ